MPLVDLLNLRFPVKRERLWFCGAKKHVQSRRFLRGED